MDGKDEKGDNYSVLPGGTKIQMSMSGMKYVNNLMEVSHPITFLPMSWRGS